MHFLVSAPFFQLLGQRMSRPVSIEEMLEVNPDIDAVIDDLTSRSAAGASKASRARANGVRLWLPISPSTAKPAASPADEMSLHIDSCSCCPPSNWV